MDSDNLQERSSTTADFSGKGPIVHIKTKVLFYASYFEGRGIYIIEHFSNLGSKNNEP